MLISPVIFTLNFATSDDQISKIINNINQDTQKISIKSLPLNNNNTDIPDKDFIRGIVGSNTKNERNEILNVQFQSNAIEPIFTLEELNNYKNLGIKITITFNEYVPYKDDIDKIEQGKLKDTWKNLFANVDYVFFNNKQDQDFAISQGYIDKRKTASLQDASLNFVESAFVSIANDQPIFSNEVLTNTKIITDKFAIKENDQIFGIKLEIDKILKDSINGEAKLKEYIEQLSEYFVKDVKVDNLTQNTINNIFEKDMSKLQPQEKNEQKQPSTGIFKKAFDYLENVVTNLFSSK